MSSQGYLQQIFSCIYNSKPFMLCSNGNKTQWLKSWSKLQLAYIHRLGGNLASLLFHQWTNSSHSRLCSQRIKQTCFQVWNGNFPNLTNHSHLVCHTKKSYTYWLNWPALLRSTNSMQFRFTLDSDNLMWHVEFFIHNTFPSSFPCCILNFSCRR